MPVRKHYFVEDGYYHVFNRGVEKRTIFTNNSDYKRFTEGLNHYRYLDPGRLAYIKNLSEEEAEKVRRKLEKQAEIAAYCLMPNHFHILVKQKIDGGISRFIGNLSNSYTKYFNTKYSRVGSLLQGEFKSVHIETDEQLIQVARYIHLNPVEAKIITKDRLQYYQWSSFPVIGSKEGICHNDLVLDYFDNNVSKYSEFCLGYDSGQSHYLNIADKTLDDE